MILLLQNFKVSVCQNPLSTRSKGSWQLGTMSAIHMMNKELKKHVGKSHGWRSLKGWSPWGRWELDTTERPHFHFLVLCIGERNGNPLQCSCLENPRDGGAWWAAVYGVTQSWTWLKRLSSSSSSFALYAVCWKFLPQVDAEFVKSFSLLHLLKWSYDLCPSFC